MPETKRFKKWSKPVIKEGKPTKWNWVVQGVKRLKLGRNTDIGAFTYIQARAGVEIGDDVQIGSHCSIYSESTIGKVGRVSKPVVLMPKCEIGSHSTIMPGVTIGRNSVIGAHSFVTQDIPDDVVAFGVPAKVKRKLE